MVKDTVAVEVYPGVQHPARGTAVYGNSDRRSWRQHWRQRHAVLVVGHAIEVITVCLCRRLTIRLCIHRRSHVVPADDDVAGAVAGQQCAITVRRIAIVQRQVVVEGACDRLTGIELEGGGARAHVAAAVVIGTLDGVQVPARGHYLLRGVGARLQAADHDPLAVRDGSGGVTDEGERVGRAIRVGLLLDDDGARLRHGAQPRPVVHVRGDRIACARAFPARTRRVAPPVVLGVNRKTGHRVVHTISGVSSDIAAIDRHIIGATAR